ncbi:MAG TPA: hydrogenase maturation protease [candidate division Zixibacteria bacterium]|nr:hydrogenase maturation protease [candidate division Zixibacteria bacterium]
MKTLVVGLGNPILTDDGVGVKVAYEVEQAVLATSRDDIDVIEASAGGLRLMEMMIGYDRLVLIDAFSSSNGHQPGRIHQLTFDDLREISPTQHSTCAHDTSFVTAIEMGRTIGLKLPTMISIYGIEVENLYEFGDEPTPAVAAAIPEAVAAVLSELHLN